MRPTFQDQLGELGGARADRCRLTADPLDGPLGVTPMGTRHVLGDGGVPAAAGAAEMNGDTFAFAEQLDGVGGDVASSCSRISRYGTE